MFLLIIWGDLSPEVKGPYKTEAARLRAARLHKVQRGDRDGLFRLYVNPEGKRGERVFVDSFTGHELELPAPAAEVGRA